MFIKGNMCGNALVCLLCLLCVHAYEEEELRTRFSNQRNKHMYCTKAQSGIDLKEMMGLWNVIEVIEHSERYTDRRNYLRTVASSDTCPVVHFATVDDRNVRMIWNDEGGHIQFSFRMTNINNPGFWMSTVYQSGTMIDDSYEHFTGTVQVMKAVQSHIVITFCSPNERHFSVILARNKYLNYDEVRGVHKQLNRVNLPLVAVQTYCRNGGLALTPSGILAVLLSLVLSCRQSVS